MRRSPMTPRRRASRRTPPHERAGAERPGPSGPGAGRVSERGRFVVLEGNDGCGKSTQAGRLVRRLEGAGHTVVATFEPGATELGRELRQILLGGDAAVTPRAEALLMAADRAQHVAEVIEPALVRGAWVVSDRFVGSSLAYQGAARRLGVDAVAALNRFATGDLESDLVVYL